MFQYTNGYLCLTTGSGEILNSAREESLSENGLAIIMIHGSCAYSYS